ncbi:hypothetical protein [Streptomyces caniscabiei]|uniref:Lipoprotein n=1 Tax=Streptomyces caniscabiei TaxID=2746961 RepID=A0ABU4MPT9_9ACTN|nr:hypothetical protein [Streptomyces caniscabiei]MBE4788401.1 hypothetical protein [Streptomyces caniscabiei]MDX2954616.1 hypothetical protein [Streptomyces caniscabiei]MDX2986587.1 hypothetical protein [Streptomyces caniscabiei]MDX3039466.1 hypothetical protein [Streptomyces caniscabiei]
MATVSTCATPIKGTHMRIIALDACGVPVTGSSGLVAVSSGFVQVEMEPDYEDGEEFFERTASGQPCVNQKDDPTLKRLALTVQMCEVNVSMLAFILSARELTTGTPTTGTGFAVAEGNPTNRFSLEVWQEVAGSGACDASGNQRYIYNAWPNVGASQLGSYTIENARSTLEFTSETRGAGPTWDTLVGDDFLPSGESVETDEHWVWNVTTTAPPTVACDPTTLAV